MVDAYYITAYIGDQHGKLRLETRFHFTVKPIAITKIEQRKFGEERFEELDMTLNKESEEGITGYTGTKGVKELKRDTEAALRDWLMHRTRTPMANIPAAVWRMTPEEFTEADQWEIKKQWLFEDI